VATLLSIEARPRPVLATGSDKGARRRIPTVMAEHLTESTRDQQVAGGAQVTAVPRDEESHW
jgi:hypothetical protein